jgi:pSer/pThr/pTyr-binding forkhead associated (FHA) protein
MGPLVLVAADHGWTFTIPPGEPAVLGRGAADVEVCIPHATVARRHARVLQQEGAWHIEDLRSHSGTYVNGAIAHGLRVLRPGDAVRVGSVVLTVATPDEEPSPSLPR